jgi:hypothetical protein
VGYLLLQYVTDDELGRIREVVDSYKVEGDLRREQNLNIKRLMEISLAVEVPIPYTYVNEITMRFSRGISTPAIRAIYIYHV